jgi:hypothetical protein
MQIRTRPLEQRDLDEADRIMRLAFGTFLGLPNPMKMFGDSDIARTRFGLLPIRLWRLKPRTSWWVRIL